MWEKERLEIFNQLCLPSMLRQALKPNMWYVLFDEVISSSIESQISALSKYSWIRPILIERRFGFSNFLVPLRHQIAKDFGPKGTYVICRLDSDDSINTYYFSVLDGAYQAWLKNRGHENVFFNFTYGVLKKDNYCHVMLNESSPFLISVESGEISSLTTSCGINHKSANSKYPVVEWATERPMWCQHLHGNNVTEYATNRYPLTVPWDAVKPYFGMVDH
jgi:hypothetical protein